MRNEGLSRKTSYPINIIFSDDVKVRVLVVQESHIRESFWQGYYWVLSVRMNEIVNQGKQEKDEENYKYFLRWSEKYPGELELEKMIILRPFNKKDGSKRQSWMSSLTLRINLDLNHRAQQRTDFLSDKSMFDFICSLNMITFSHDLS